MCKSNLLGGVGCGVGHQGVLQVIGRWCAASVGVIDDWGPNSKGVVKGESQPADD